MKISMVMTLIGKDRPGLVEAVSGVIEEHGGNWEESRMAQLAGEFAGLVHLHVPEERAADLEAALGQLDDLRVVVARATDEEPPAGTHALNLEVVGPDQPGIVHQLTAALAAQGINVEELESEITSAPMSGEKLFRARAKLRAPQSLTHEELEEALEQIAASLMADISVDES